MCTCERPFKIPVTELAFIQDQREKVGARGKLFIGGINKKETQKEKEKKEKEDKLQAHNQKVQQAADKQFQSIDYTDLSDDDINETQNEDLNDESFILTEPKQKTSNQNRDSIENFIRECER